MSRINKYFSRLIKRTKLRLYLWAKNLSIAPQYEEKPSLYEKVSFKICLKCINHDESEFMIDPITDKRYINNDELGIFISLSDRRVDITNHVYHYNVKLTSRNWSRIIFIFDKETNKRRVDMENTVNSQIKNSLNDVYERISKM